MAKTQIKNYVFKPGIGSNDNLFPNAYGLLSANKLFIQKEATAWIQDQVDAGTSGFVGYTYNSEKCERDIGYNIDAYLFDLRYGGNEKTRNTIKYYWDQDVAQIDGDRQPEIQTYTFISTLIENFILANIAYNASNNQVTQIIDLTKTAEADAINKLSTLVSNTVSVITTGLSAMPAAIESGVGTIKIQGRYDLEDILLITNTTTNEIIYNFSNPATGASVEFKTDNISSDSDFSAYLQATDAITIITLNYNTSGQSSTDELQIFLERVENGKSVTITRPYDFGTDAIERMRVAQPASMLDADFEYGLQPTKWAAISTLRGYPSVYEIPGTDAPVISVVTDASAGTDGVGQSLITVTTVSPHGFEAGTPVTIKALEDSIVGAARAEGSFVINTVPTNNTFTYFAKSKVGTTAGDVLSTTYTQLRQAGFYTGANIGRPNITVQSNGFSGTVVAELDVTVGSTVVPFDGPSPEVGAPLTNANMPVGTQVTAVIDTSAGGGTYITPIITDNVAIGENRVFLESTAGIVNNLATDRGDGTAIYVNNIDASYIDFNNSFTSALVPNKKTYTAVDGQNDSVIGNGATFDVTLSQNVSRDYTVVVNSIGSDYKVGDRIIIPGTALGGQSPINDLTINVTGINSLGGITSISISGAHWDGTLSAVTVNATYAGGVGTGAVFDLAFDAGAYTSVVPSTGTVVYDNPANSYNGAVGFGAIFEVTRTLDVYSITIGAAGQDYLATETFTILGTDLGGASPANDATVTIDTIGVSGEILTASITGTGVNTADNSSNYILNDILLISGSAINGADGVHDLYITVDGIDGSGAITSLSYSGTPPPVINSYSSSQTGFTTTSAAGTGVIFTIDQAAGTYGVNIITAGTNYLPTETITVAGTQLGGISPANDLTITIDNVDGGGEITAITVTGTASTSGNIKAVSSGSNIVGVGATFDVSIISGNYSTVINTAGTGYGAGQTLTVPGILLSGETPTNDLTITIDTVDALTTGAISTISSAGTVATPGGTYTSVSGTNEQPLGTSATFDVSKNFTAYDSVVVSTAGTGYKAGDRVILLGTLFDGSSPANDIVLTVSTTGANGEVETLTYDYTEAVYGSNFDLISTILISESTTGTIVKNEQITYEALATLEIAFDTAHGLVPGNTFIVTISSDSGTNGHKFAAGSFFATEIPTVNTLRYTARAAGTIDVDGGADPINAEVYPRPDSFFVHRPFDGGVQLGTGGPQHGAQAIRQSKKYIRYQSGKGIMYTTGALFAPSYDLRSVTADGVEVNSLITVVTDDNDHGVQPGGIIRLLGIETPGYNSGPQTAVPPQFDYEVVNVIDERTFQIRSQRRLGSTTAVLGFGSQMSVVSWHGATVRSGIFDDQNGIFWEFDGTQISVVQRTGTQQLAGTLAMSVDNNLVTGTNTRFRDQLKAGDRIIIKGMTHVVSYVNSQTEITVTPDWRGVVDITGAKANLIVDKKAKQSEFNLDRLDGTGPSGYEIDIAKMQMIGIQYSWYGAGFIDFMLRGADGNFVFAHRMRNSNVNTEAFMRSGNLPVRYEVSNEGPSGKLASAMTNSQTSMILDDTSFFPNSGVVYIDNEIISFSGNNKATNTLTGLIRSATFTNFQAGATRSYTAGGAVTHDARTGVVLISQTITPLISHWGSAFITDGLFDEDRGYIFSYAETNVEVSTTKQTAFLIRLSPSVSNAIIGDLGERELLNRAQLLLQGLEITSDGTDSSDAIIRGGIVVEGILNPQNYPLNPDDIGWSGLSGVAQGGQPSFAQIAAGGSVSWSTGEAPTTANITAQATISVALNSGQFFSGNNNGIVYVSATDYRNTFGSNDTGIVTGKTITGANIPANTTITGGFIQSSGNYGYFVISRRTQGGVNANTANAYTVTEGGNLTNRNSGLFTKTSVDNSGARVGTAVTGGSAVTFPANTLINNITLKTFGPTEYYDVQFNNSYSGTLVAGTGTVQVTFVQPPFAQPGETVFSFIATPGERSTLDLSELKELTNTPLGGRGTYPNGPDVLAINVYKVSGADVPANIILRWGEAQA